jgi:N utilization substance protein B
MTRDTIGEAWRAVREDERLPSEAREFVEALVTTLDESLPAIDARITQTTEHWNFERLAATDRGVLRLATAELLFLPGTPAQVVLDEAIDIARKFGREESGHFVNGVLDRIAREARPGELEAAPAGRAARRPAGDPQPEGD